MEIKVKKGKQSFFSLQFIPSSFFFAVRPFLLFSRMLTFPNNKKVALFIWFYFYYRISLRFIFIFIREFQQNNFQLMISSYTHLYGISFSTVVEQTDGGQNERKNDIHELPRGT